jgi:hypothetical protein
MDNIYKVKVDDSFTMCMLDASMKEAYIAKKKVVLLFDLRKACLTHLRHIFSISPVLEKYREQSKEYLKCTTIIVSTHLAKQNFNIKYYET